MIIMCLSLVSPNLVLAPPCPAVFVFFAIIGGLVVLYRMTDAKSLPRVKRWSRWFFGTAVALNPTAKLKIVCECTRGVETTH